MSARNVLSILYLRCALHLGARGAPCYSTFNSLFEMHRLRLNRCGAEEVRLSILYLRCEDGNATMGGEVLNIFQFSI